MPREVKVGEAKTHLSKLLARVEAGEEIVIARGREPIARLVRIERSERRKAAIEAIRALRRRVKPFTLDELRAWKDEGRRS